MKGLRRWRRWNRLPIATGQDEGQVEPTTAVKAGVQVEPTVTQVLVPQGAESGKIRAQRVSAHPEPQRTRGPEQDPYEGFHFLQFRGSAWTLPDGSIRTA